MTLNVTQVLFSIFFLITALVGFLFRVVDLIVPELLEDSRRYEKYTYFITEHLCFTRVAIPERWFKHFFKLPVVAMSILLFIAVNTYVNHADMPEVVYSVLDRLLGFDRKALVTAETTLLALILLTVHFAQRFVEMHFIAKFNDGKTREFCNYLFIYVHYGFLIPSIVGESAGFVRDTRGDIRLSRITPAQWIAAGVFLIGSYEQFRTNWILADMSERPRKKGKWIRLPLGGLFDYVSGAVELTEMIVYLALSVVLTNSTTVHFVCLWLIANESMMAFFAHTYYKKHCRHFPKNRKIILPFVH